MLYISFLFFTLPTYLLLYDLLHTPIPVFSYRFFCNIFYRLGWLADGARADRQAYRSSTGWASAAGRGEGRTGAHMYVCYDVFLSFSPSILLLAVFTPFFHFLITWSVQVWIMFFCGPRSRPVLVGVFFTAPYFSWVRLGTGFPRKGSVADTFLLHLHWLSLSYPLIVFIVYYLPPPSGEVRAD